MIARKTVHALPPHEKSVPTWQKVVVFLALSIMYWNVLSAPSGVKRLQSYYQIQFLTFKFKYFLIQEVHMMCFATF
jgi:hypothetical protein